MTIEYIYNYIKSNLDKSPNDVIVELSNKYNPLDVELVYNIDFEIFLDKEQKEEREKRLDAKFRKEVKARYNNKCIISEVSVERCDVAHIIPFSECNEINKYDINNGLLLDTALHRLFDKYYFSINPKTNKIEVNMNLKNLEDLCIKDYNNKHIEVFENSKKYLEKHYKEYNKYLII
jgi:predicted restriction endonuclease